MARVGTGDEAVAPPAEGRALFLGRVRGLADRATCKVKTMRRDGPEIPGRHAKIG